MGGTPVPLRAQVTEPHDMRETRVEILAIVAKGHARLWLEQKERSHEEDHAFQGQRRLVNSPSDGENEVVVITRRGKPAGVLIGFKSEDDWLDYRLQNDPRFLANVETDRLGLRTGRGVKLEGVRQ